MRRLTPTRFKFTPSEIHWLSGQAITNELAADIIVRYNRLYAVRKPAWLPHRPRLVQ